MSEAVQTEVARTLPIVVHVPRVLKLTDEQVGFLENRWTQDLVKAAEQSDAKIKIHWTIEVHVKIGNE